MNFLLLVKFKNELFLILQYIYIIVYKVIYQNRLFHNF